MQPQEDIQGQARAKFSPGDLDCASHQGEGSAAVASKQLRVDAQLAASDSEQALDHDLPRDLGGTAAMNQRQPENEVGSAEVATSISSRVLTPTSPGETSGAAVGSQGAEETLVQAVGKKETCDVSCLQRRVGMLRREGFGSQRRGSRDAETACLMYQDDVVDLHRARLLREGRICVSCHWLESQVTLHPCGCRRLCWNCFGNEGFFCRDPKLCPWCREKWDGIIFPLEEARCRSQMM